MCRVRVEIIVMHSLSAVQVHATQFRASCAKSRIKAFLWYFEMKTMWYKHSRTE